MGVERKSLLYKSGLGFYCINHVVGCAHGCLYPCYAFMMAKHYGRAHTYAEWCKPELVTNAEELLERELARKRNRAGIACVHLSLTTDPFMHGHPEVHELSLRLIAKLNSHGLAASVLTKGVLPAELADRRRFGQENTYGISIVSLDEGFRRRWEPGAAPYAERIAAARLLHDAGQRTLAHLEPYPTPNIVAQELDSILAAVAFVDEIYFSGWNYSSVVNDYPDHERFYRQERARVHRFCRARHIACVTD